MRKGSHSGRKYERWAWVMLLVIFSQLAVIVITIKAALAVVRVARIHGDTTRLQTEFYIDVIKLNDMDVNESLHN